MPQFDVYVSEINNNVRLITKKGTPFDKIQEYSNTQECEAYNPFKFNQVVDGSSLSEETIKHIDENGYKVSIIKIVIKEEVVSEIPDF